jgi:hypothetical protein
MAFETVLIERGNGAEETLTKDQFYAIPLLERMSLLSNSKLKFFEAGKPISAVEALKRN